MDVSSESKSMVASTLRALREQFADRGSSWRSITGIEADRRSRGVERTRSELNREREKLHRSAADRDG